MSPEAIAIIAAAAAIGGYLWGLFTAAPCDCPKCAFHVNERRMKGYEADRKRQESAELQTRLRHDAAHKGWGWAPGDPDKFNCEAEDCARNKPGRGENSI